MVMRPIPRWLAALDEEKPYVEVLDGERLPDVSPKDAHGFIAFRIGQQIDACLTARSRSSQRAAAGGSRRTTGS